MKASANLQLPRFDLSKAEALVQAYVRSRAEAAARAWLSVTAPIVPVWSGASRATFTKLGSAVGADIDISPEVPSRIGIGVSSSEGQLTVEGARASFKYSTTLPWLVYNEFNNANDAGFHLRNPGPYRFQEAGLRALQGLGHLAPPDLSGCVNIRTMTV